MCARDSYSLKWILVIVHTSERALVVAVEEDY
jgi:hypothetical protein